MIDDRWLQVLASRFAVCPLVAEMRALLDQAGVIPVIDRSP